MIEDMRLFLGRMEADSRSYGMPYSIVKKNLICLTPNPVGSTLKNLYMLEFHPWLAAASRVMDAVRTALEVRIFLVYSLTTGIGWEIFKLLINRMKKSNGQQFYFLVNLN